jgi:hypothetical protein
MNDDLKERLKKFATYLAAEKWNNSRCNYGVDDVEYKITAVEEATVQIKSSIGHLLLQVLEEE